MVGSFPPAYSRLSEIKQLSPEQVYSLVKELEEKIRELEAEIRTKDINLNRRG